MRILLDECLPRRLKRLFVGHDAKTVPEAGWAGIKNGQLLRLAAASFQVFVTVDRNLSFQNPLAEIPISVLILHAPSNRFDDLAPLLVDVERVLQSLTPGFVAHLPI